MRRKLLSIVVGVATCVMPFTGVASAGALADTTVTIRTENGDFWGFVSSPRPLRCADGRKVVLFKQTGPEQDPRADERVASDTASLNGDRYEWNTGNTGMFGRFYARVARTDTCRGDTSNTIRSVRP